ncbi:hypothetical protein ACS0TY_000360 [Phlomoides rotata]
MCKKVARVGLAQSLFQMRASPTSVYPTLLVVIVVGEDDNINLYFPNTSIVIVEDEEDNIRLCIPNILIVIVA